MVTTYIPKKSFFEPTRIQRIAKDILKECDEDRAKALEAFDYFKKKVNGGGEEAISEMAKCLKLTQDASNNKIKILDLMLKMSQTELKVSPQKEKGTKFSELKKNNQE